MITDPTNSFPHLAFKNALPKPFSEFGAFRAWATLLLAWPYNKPFFAPNWCFSLFDLTVRHTHKLVLTKAGNKCLMSKEPSLYQDILITRDGSINKPCYFFNTLLSDLLPFTQTPLSCQFFTNVLFFFSPNSKKAACFGHFFESHIPMNAHRS